MYRIDMHPRISHTAHKQANFSVVQGVGGNLFQDISHHGIKALSHADPIRHMQIAALLTPKVAAEKIRMQALQAVQKAKYQPPPISHNLDMNPAMKPRLPTRTPQRLE